MHPSTTRMVASVKQSATRAFVAVLALLAKSYEVVLAVGRDSSEQELLKAYRRLSLKVRPDKGCRVRDIMNIGEYSLLFFMSIIGCSHRLGEFVTTARRNAALSCVVS